MILRQLDIREGSEIWMVNIQSGVGGERELEDRKESEVELAGGKSHITLMFDLFERLTFNQACKFVYLPNIV